MQVVEVEQCVAQIAVSRGQESGQLGGRGERRSVVRQFGKDAGRNIGRHQRAVKLWKTARDMCGDDQPAIRALAGTAQTIPLPARKLFVAVDDQHNRGVQAQCTGGQSGEMDEAIMECM
jgi:hypothetical protein